MPRLATKNRHEINLLRLLAKTEAMAKNYQDDEQWRIKAYVQALGDYLDTLKECEDRKPSKEQIDEYSKKIEFLQKLYEAKKLPTAAERAKASQLLKPADTQTLPNLVITQTGKQIKQATVSKTTTEMKKELLSKESDEPSNTVRHRNIAATRVASKDTDAALKHQQDIQDQIADEMIALTRNLKHNIQASGKIIKQDTQALQDSSKQTDKNTERLKHESSRLEAHLHKGANWWLWIGLAVVCATFIFMIVFIRFFPKPR